MQTESPNSKSSNPNLILIGVLIFLVSLLALTKYDEYNKNTKEQRQQIKDLEQTIQRLDAENKELYSKDKKIQIRIDSLKEAQTKTLKKYEDEKKKLLESQERFRALPIDVRDSILRQYIRANQQPYRS